MTGDAERAETPRVRTRFAPSPTGSMHVGNARVAVLNWLLARHHGGDFVLRIEDTDADRNVAGAEAEILADLRWLGLDWDEGPVRQSERLRLYHEAVARLERDDRVYPCYCSPDDLERERERAIAEERPPVYSGACRELDAAGRARLEAEGRSAALRFRTPAEGSVVVEDAVRGAVEFDAAGIGDFVIVRSDGLPTYNFAVVVDDADMAISHVVRGVGHLSNTPRQVLLFQALGATPPVFAHVPTVLGPDRQKLSKRRGAAALADYREEGLHPDAVLNYLSLLAWSSPSGDEILSRERLIEEISLDRIRSGDVVFDETKLRWMSARHIEAMPLDTLVEAVLPHLDRVRYPLTDAALPIAVDAVRSHLSAFGEIDDHLAQFVAPLDDDGRAAAARLAHDAGAGPVVASARAQLENAEWTPDAIGAAVRAAGKQAGARGPALYHPLRIATTGRTEGPPLNAILAVLGRPETLRRLEAAAPHDHGADV